MEDEKYYTITGAAALTTFSPNTLRAWVKTGKLKAEKVEGLYGSEYRIRAHDLYHSDIPKLNRRLGPQMTEVRKVEAEASALASSEKYLEELSRLSRELVEAKTELGILQFQVPALQAAQEEKDKLKEETEKLRASEERSREERDRLAQEKVTLVEERATLSAKADVLEIALEQARANAKWGYRRKQRKQGGRHGPDHGQETV